MLPVNPWEYQNAIKTLYARCVGKVCTKHGLTRMELDILLFLANNPRYDTATDMVEVRYLSKSQVSGAVRLLEGKGYLRKEYMQDNKKTAHLKICKTAAFVIADGRAAQEEFIAVLTEGLSGQERESMRRCLKHVRKNIDIYLKEETKLC